MTDSANTFLYGLRYSRLRDVLRGRLDASLDWRNSIEMAELPAELTGAVRQVVSRTRLWRREKVDVASELITHFQDGLAAGRTPEELLRTFGDPKAAAQLIRRAKKRGRPAMWQLFRYGLIGIVLLLLVYISTGLWMATGRPSIKVDYSAVINKSSLSVPEDQRAWPLYRDALLAMGAKSTQPASVVMDLIRDEAKPGDENWNEMNKFLATQAESIAKLREAAIRPKLGFVTCVFAADFSEKDRELFGYKPTAEEFEVAKNQSVQDRWFISLLLPELEWLRTTALLLASDARRAAREGDANTALDDVAAMLGVSRHCQEKSLLMCEMFAESVQRQTRAVIYEILTDQPKLWSNDQLRSLAHELSGSRIDWRSGLNGERSGFYDCMQRIYTDNGHGDGRLALHITDQQNLFQVLDAMGRSHDASAFSSEAVAMLSLPIANIVVAPRKEMTQVYDDMLDRALSRLDTPYWEWTKEPQLDEEVQSLSSTPLGKFRYCFVGLLTPSYDGVLRRVTESRGEHDGVLIGLALELFYRENNKWPQSLADLSPRWMPVVPVDRITGKALHYKIVNDRPVVSSVGHDGDDDGDRAVASETGKSDASKSGHTELPTVPRGTAAPDGDWILWTTGQQ